MQSTPRAEPDRDLCYGPEHLRRARAVLENRQDRSFELRLVRPDGGVRTVLSNGEVHTDERGYPIGLLGTFQDVTDVRPGAIARRLKTCFPQPMYSLGNSFHASEKIR